jgi:cell division cycle protein 37
MRKTARQYLLLTYVCDLAKSMPGRDARDAIRPLFRKMASSDESREAFSDHLVKYIAHVKTRAEVKKKEAEEEEEGEEESEYVALKKGEQVGPGGLDPAEVFETLPKVLQEAFGERSIDALKQCLSQMSTEDAQYHMKRCTGSRWLPPPVGPAPPRPRQTHARTRARTHARTHTCTLTRARTTRRSCATDAGL